ncbi:extracellular solute-binding protein [Saxibacter everestensis]|uniref:Extracellular solute-binding protein n=1 Tax=Saxibacter everestensis TaxID=2909229 RepID=A0ABY8QWA0_9MICO|nr:extracellular solute-binding protein [Brevibacteriaceae bacterium ZFBP1038]
MTGSHSPNAPSRRTIIKAIGGAAFTVPLLAAAGCGSGVPEQNTLRISYQQWGSGEVLVNYLTDVIKKYTANHPDISVELVPLVASENDYFTKNELMMSSSRTAPDLVYEDTFILKSDIAAGYLRPIDKYIDGWPQWEHFYDVAKNAVQGEDGRTYAVPTPTDTRALWYNQELLKKAGIETPWKPRSWDDLLETFRTIKKELPEVIPFNIYSGKPQGEKASMQGMEMLLYGTESTLYDEEKKKWVVGSAGFTQSLEFIRTVFSEKLGPTLGKALDPNITETIYNTWLPQGQLAVLLDGNWISSNWGEGLPGEWPEWTETMQLAEMPTRDGQDPGFVTMSGGWSWGMPKKASKPDLAWPFLREMMSTDNVTAWTISDSKLTNRKDVAARKEYQGYSPTADFFSRLVPGATYRPALAPYPEISSAIQSAMESVMIGAAEPAAAAAVYDSAVAGIVGAENTMKEA